MEKFKFKLKGKTLVIIDWANVYGWFKKLKWEIDPERLYQYLKSYSQIKEIRFYFGVEKGNQKSEQFQRIIKKIGYKVVSKELKWVPLNIDKEYFKKALKNIFSYYGFDKKFLEEFFEKLKEDKNLKRRKCDFDCEIAIDVMKNINKFSSFIIFSGDGDYVSLVEEIINSRKQIIVVALKNAMGKEYAKFKKGVFICNIKKLKEFVKKIPGR